jgi:hypothetical protein
MFGWCMTVADFDSDGYCDLAVSAPFDDIDSAPQDTGIGRVFAIYGSADGLLDAV